MEIHLILRQVRTQLLLAKPDPNQWQGPAAIGLTISIENQLHAVLVLEQQLWLN